MLTRIDNGINKSPVESDWGTQLQSLFDGLARFMEKLGEIDWHEVISTWNEQVKAHIEATRILASKGWTIPGWATVPEITSLVGFEEKDIDAFFTKTYTDNDFQRLKTCIANLIAVPEMAIWQPLLLEVRDSIISGRHLIAVPALLTILEGYAIGRILKLTGDDVGKTNLSKLFAKTDFHKADGIQALPWISNLMFMETLFASYHFGEEPPSRLNRHWILHGRSVCDWHQADAFRLLNALETLRWLAELKAER